MTWKYKRKFTKHFPCISYLLFVYNMLFDRLKLQNKKENMQMWGMIINAHPEVKVKILSS